MVGEKGPEMLSLEPGATVTPLTKLNAATVVQQAPPQPTTAFDYNKFAQAIAGVSIRMGQSELNTQMGIGTRRI